MADATDLKSVVFLDVRVQVPLRVPFFLPNWDKKHEIDNLRFILDTKVSIFFRHFLQISKYALLIGIQQSSRKTETNGDLQIILLPWTDVFSGSFVAKAPLDDGVWICHGGKDTLTRHAEQSEASRKKQ